MLFQPTNVSPSSLGELGNGTVDATQDLTVSWQVNGASPLVAYSITIYLNNSASTQKYTTGKITSGCPFYGTNYAGEAQFFSYTIPSATLSSAGITNGNNYKLVIRQWWNANDSVTQSSASAFITRKSPTLTLGAISSPVSTRSYTFTATYSQAQGDALNWARWMLATSDDTDSPLYDSGNIYGTSDLQFSYDGLFQDVTYSVRCMVQTENGISADTGWVDFSVEYYVAEIAGAVVATKACNRSAVEVTWPLIKSIPGTATGSYTLGSSGVTLPAGSSIEWDSVNAEAMSYSSPWTILFKGQIANEDVTPLVVTQSGGNIVIDYTRSATYLSISFNGSQFYGIQNVEPFAIITLIVSADSLWIRIDDKANGLYPDEALYPSGTLYPKKADNRTRKFLSEITGLQSTLSSIQINGNMVCSWVKVIQGNPSESVIQEAWSEGTYVPTRDDYTMFLADFSSSIDAGILDSLNDTITGISVYRQDRNGRTIAPIADLGVDSTSFLDYGARSQQGPYVYQVFPVGATTYISTPISSNSISPCFWDWSLLSCTKRDDNTYRVDAEYRFGKNLASGNVGNNNAPLISQNFTRYPTIQMSPSNWKSGSLQSLIGAIDYTNGQNTYSDTLDLRDAIYSLSTNTNPLFLKNRKGDLLSVRIAGEISMETYDNTKEQAQFVSLPWVEVGNASRVSITVNPGDELFGGGESA